MMQDANDSVQSCQSYVRGNHRAAIGYHLQIYVRVSKPARPVSRCDG